MLFESAIFGLLAKPDTDIDTTESPVDWCLPR